MQRWGLNTYLYGPKDDLKHRLLWREVYSTEEEGIGLFYMWHLFIYSWPPFIFNSRSLSLYVSAAQLKALVHEAESSRLKFVYALSPGQDIVFSSSSDLTLLKRKLRQVFGIVNIHSFMTANQSILHGRNDCRK